MWFKKQNTHTSTNDLTRSLSIKSSNIPSSELAGSKELCMSWNLLKKKTVTFSVWWWSCFIETSRICVMKRTCQAEIFAPQNLQNVPKMFYIGKMVTFWRLAYQSWTASVENDIKALSWRTSRHWELQRQPGSIKITRRLRGYGIRAMRCRAMVELELAREPDA